MLILFDIDGTLLSTSRVGIEALRLAGHEVFGEGFVVENIEFAGRLDPLIIDDLLEPWGKRGCADHHQQIRAGYGRHLGPLVGREGTTLALPGVHELLGEVSRIDGATLGLVTGNFPETGRIKIAAAGIDPDLFEINAWGSDSSSTPPTRDDLPGVAMERYAESTGRALDGSAVVVIGDTPHDVSCARAHGCRSIAVATGIFDSDQLRSSGADLVVETLADTAMLSGWIAAGAAARG